MIGRLNHVAIAVRDIGKATALYRDVLGAEVSAAVAQPDHGVTTVAMESTGIYWIPLYELLEANGFEVLLVDCPLTSLQALALDRAAGVYLPLHVLLRSQDGGTHASIVNPADVFDGRLPAGAAEPIARLTERVAGVLDGLAKAGVQTS